MTRQRTQPTVRGFDEELQRRIRSLARSEGISLNQAVLRLLRRGAGLAGPGERADVVGSSLDYLIGTWTEEEAREVEEAIEVFERIDPSLWQ